jgi:putative flippase GtrA
VPRSRFVRFLLVGGLNTLFGYSLFALFAWFGLPYPVAIGLATLAGITFNFQSTGRLVFGSAPWSRLARFAGVYALVYTLNVGAVAVLHHLGLNIYLANALVLLPLAMIAYMLQRTFVFSAP